VIALFYCPATMGPVDLGSTQNSFWCGYHMGPDLAQRTCHVIIPSPAYKIILSVPHPARIQVSCFRSPFRGVVPAMLRAVGGRVLSEGPSGVAVACVDGFEVLGCAVVSETDIWGAARKGDLREVERLVGRDPGLLDAPLDVRDGLYGWTPLLWASDEGHMEVVQWLVRQGAVVDKGDLLGRTPLWWASWHGRTPVVRLLVESGADPTAVDAYRTCPLTTASAKGQIDVVRRLLDHPSVAGNLNRRDEHGRTGGRPATGAGGGS
jgi:hypothetical protein